MPALPLISAGTGLLSTVGGMVAGQQQAADQKKALKRQEAARRAASGLARTDFLAGEKDINTLTSEPLAELEGAQTAIRSMATPEQQEAMKATNLALTQQGVTGPQAATIQSREQGKMRQDLLNRIQQMALDEAGRRRDIKSGFLGQKTQISQPVSYGV